MELAVGAYPFAYDAGELAWHRNPIHPCGRNCGDQYGSLAHYKPAGSAQTPPEVKKRAEWIERESGKERSSTSVHAGKRRASSCALGLLDRLASPEPPPLNHPANEHYAEGYYVFPNIHKILSKEQKK